MKYYKRTILPVDPQWMFPTLYIRYDGNTYWTYHQECSQWYRYSGKPAERYKYVELSESEMMLELL